MISIPRYSSLQFRLTLFLFILFKHQEKYPRNAAVNDATSDLCESQKRTKNLFHIFQHISGNRKTTARKMTIFFHDSSRSRSWSDPTTTARIDDNSFRNANSSACNSTNHSANNKEIEKKNELCIDPKTI